jgi:hypothetical protein
MFADAKLDHLLAYLVHIPAEQFGDLLDRVPVLEPAHMSTSRR